MNQDTNRSVRHEQETERGAAGMDCRDREMRLPPQDAYRPQPYAPLPADYGKRRSKPWHSRGWLWLVVTVLGTGAVVAGLLAVAGEIDGIRTALQEQTNVLREQNGLLDSLGYRLDQLTAAANRVADAVRDAVSHWLGSM